MTRNERQHLTDSKIVYTEVREIVPEISAEENLNTEKELCVISYYSDGTICVYKATPYEKLFVQYDEFEFVAHEEPTKFVHYADLRTDYLGAKVRVCK